MKKTLFIFLGIIILIIVFSVFGFYYFNNQDLCKKIDEEILKQKCISCENTKNIVDCKDEVYVEFSFLKGDKSLCDDLVQEYRKAQCLVNIEHKVIRGAEGFNYEVLDSGGYRKVS